jgi:hypothetical protein
MKMNNALLNDISDRGKIDSYFYGMANTMFWKPKSKFYTTYKVEYLELIENCLPDESEDPFNVKEYLNEKGLTPTEKLWVETCLEYKFNYSLAGKKIGVSRMKVSQRINAIIDKYK